MPPYTWQYGTDERRRTYTLALMKRAVPGYRQCGMRETILLVL